jgi:hypothetical protein
MNTAQLMLTHVEINDATLRLAVAAYLVRDKGSRIHTESDLRSYLRWCRDRDLHPLQACRAQIELYLRWMQEVQRFQPSTVSRRLLGARQFFTRALATGSVAVEVSMDRAAAHPRVLDELVPAAPHITKRYPNNQVEADGQPSARQRPIRGVNTFQSARPLAAGHAFVQNLRRGHYQIATDQPAQLRLRAAFDELAQAV